MATTKALLANASKLGLTTEIVNGRTNVEARCTNAPGVLVKLAASLGWDVASDRNPAHDSRVWVLRDQRGAYRGQILACHSIPGYAFLSVAQ